MCLLALLTVCLPYADHGMVYYSEPRCAGRAYVLRDTTQVARAGVGGVLFVGAPDASYATIRSVRSETACQSLGMASFVAYPVLYVAQYEPAKEPNHCKPPSGLAIAGRAEHVHEALD